MRPDILPNECSWDINNICNYHCPYCDIPLRQQHPEIAKQHLALSVNDWIRFWRALYNRYGEFEITIAGGEPFRIGWLPDIIIEVTRWHRVHVNTNLSWELEKVLPKFSASRTSFSASFHYTQTEIDPFIKKISLLRHADFAVTIPIVAYPPNFDSLPNFARQLISHFPGLNRDRDFGLFFLPYQGRYEGKDFPEAYTEDQKRWLLQENRKLARFHLQMKALSPFGQQCAAGQRYFRIRPDGSIFRCAPIARMKLKPLGHVKQPSLELDKGPAPCPASACTCPGEYRYLLGN